MQIFSQKRWPAQPSWREFDDFALIHQVGVENGVPYVAMQLLRGQSLEERLRQAAPLPIPEVLDLGRQIARGLAAAHARGLIHRDIKPANLWLEDISELRLQLADSPGAPQSSNLQSEICNLQSRIKILDFGLARPVSDDAHLTQSGAILGTPAYMAPEQAGGEAVDARADLFSLGVVLYRMCTGSLPFAGKTTLAVLKSLAADSPPPPHKLNPAVPEALSALVMDLLQKDSAQRPASAREVALRLSEPEALARVALAPASAAQAAAARDAVQLLAHASGSEKSPALGAGLPTPPPEPTAGLQSPPPAQGDLRSAEWPGPETRPRLSRPRLTRRVLIAATLLLALIPLAWLFAPAVIRIVTNQGLLIVETDDPDIEVTVKENGVTLLDKKGQRTITLAAGNHKLDVTVKDAGGELRFFTSEFNLSRGGKKVVNVRQEMARGKGKELPVKGHEDVDRWGAEWTLSLGGMVNIIVDGEEKRVADIKDLPGKPFRLKSVMFEPVPNEKPNDQQIAELGKLKHLDGLWVSSTQVSEKGLQVIRDLRKLRILAVFNVPVSDDFLRIVEAMPDLESLDVVRGATTHNGLRHLRSLKKLQRLGYDTTDKGGEALKHLNELPKLGHLSLGGAFDGTGFEQLSSTILTTLHLQPSGLNDEGLQKLKPRPSLTALNVNQTKITGRCLDHVSKFTGLENLSIGMNAIADDDLAVIATLPKLTNLDCARTAIGDKGVRHIAKIKKLTQLELSHTKITDAGLKLLAELRELKQLNVTNTKVTPEGVAALRKALPKCEVFFDPPASLPDKDRPFLLVKADGKVSGEFKFFQQALDQHQDGDAIEIHGNGPFVVNQVYVKDKRFTMRAGTGFRPVIKTPPALKPVAWLGLETAQCNIEGIDCVFLSS
ncbi:MAG: hypothetical protein FJ271_21530 [Planctomycetes bacterium]|nr:hypothetical protein [Planctomycetota bacterium]